MIFGSLSVFFRAVVIAATLCPIRLLARFEFPSRAANIIHFSKHFDNAALSRIIVIQKLKLVLQLTINTLMLEQHFATMNIDPPIV